MSSTVDLAVTADSVTEAKLPQRYEAAVMAIAECDRIDECKTWSDKAAALASYARQAKDDTLRVMAVRIQARALRRGGELLKRIEPAKNQHGTAPTRADSAKAAGLSERQRKTALRVASVPDDEFNAALESDSPPTVTQLAERGTIRREQTCDVAAAAVDNEVPPVILALVAFVTACEKEDAGELAIGFDPEDAMKLRQWVAKADRWLDRFVANLPA